MTLTSDTARTELAQLLDEANTAIADADSATAVEALRIKYLGKKGRLTEQLKRLGSLPANERPLVGKWVNEAKQTLQARLSDRRQALESVARRERLSTENIDVTLPGRGLAVGGLHLV